MPSKFIVREYILKIKNNYYSNYFYSLKKMEASINSHICSFALKLQKNQIISLFWSFKSEAGVKNSMDFLHYNGYRLALPFVVSQGLPMVFYPYCPNIGLKKDALGMDLPVSRETSLIPEIIFAPFVSLEKKSYHRVGYGGGYFDRTLSQFTHKPLCIGVGYSFQVTQGIQAEPHDYPMNGYIDEYGFHQ